MSSVNSVGKNRVALGAIVLIAVVIRLLWIGYADFTPTLSDDAGRYDFLGQSLAAGGGFINPNGTTTMFWPPGYPFLLSTLYRITPSAHEVTVALVFNAVIGAATCIPIYALASRIRLRLPSPLEGEGLGVRVAPLAAAALFAFFPSMIFFSGVTLTETWFTFLLTTALYLLVLGEEHNSWPIRIATALLIGYAALVRGQAMLLPLVAIPFWLTAAKQAPPLHGVERGSGGEVPSSHRSLLLKIAAATALAAAVVLPWTIRNYIESDSFVALSSNAGVDFYIGHSEDATGRGRIVDELVFRYPELPQPEAEARINREGFREGIEFAIKNPVREVELSVKKVWYLYNGDHEALAWTDGHGERPFMAERTRNALAAISSGYYFIIMAMAVVGIALWLRARSWRTDATGVLLLSVVAYWTIVHVAFFGDQRFHAPILPLMCIWAAVIVGVLVRRIRPTPDESS